MPEVIIRHTRNSFTNFSSMALYGGEWLWRGYYRSLANVRRATFCRPLACIKRGRSRSNRRGVSLRLSLYEFFRRKLKIAFFALVIYAALC